MKGLKSFFYKFQSIIGLRIILIIEYLIKKNTDSVAIFDSRNFFWTQHFRESISTIQNELEAILISDVKIPKIDDLSFEQNKIIEKGEWNTYFLCAYGQYINKNCEACPKTFEIIKSVPEIQTAFFSIFKPNTSIKPHRGIFNGVLRYHLALKTPINSSACGIRVNAQTIYWQVGEDFIFDDTFEHEAWNYSNETRIVLCIDFEKPMPAWLKPLNRFLIQMLGSSLFIRQIKNNIEIQRTLR